MYDAMAAALDQQMNQFVAGSIIKGTISGVKGNEVLVDIGYKSEGVVPANEFADLALVKAGDVIDVLLVELESDNGMVVLSKARADEKLRWDAVLNKYTEGGVVTGTIRSKVRGGLIVNVDGVDAFLPGSQVDVTPVHDPDPYLGTTCEFKVIKISNERRNIIVSRRELIEERLADKKRELLGTIGKGQQRRGRVKNITDFGAFVDLDGLDGLLHITDMSWGRIKHPSEMLKVGQEIDVVILDVDMDRERVSLGLKQATPNPWDNIEGHFPVGSRLRGKVRNFTTYGAFVELEEGIDGMIHVSDMSWTRKINHPSEVLQKSQQVEAVVLEVNPADQRISLGLKQASDDPWNTITSRYGIGQIVKGKVSKIASFGAFVELEDGVDGLVHISQISDQHVEKVKDALKVGQEVEARIVKIDRDERRIGLSIKAVSMNENQIAELTRDLSVTDLKPGENLVGLAAAFDDAFAQSEEWRPGADQQ